MDTTPEPIAVVGNINIDVRAGPIPADPRILADGETSIGDIHDTIGGGGANTAVAAATMGGDVQFIGAIGADAAGERLSQFLKTHGVNAHLAIKPVATGRSIALTFEGSQRHFLSCLPSSALLDSHDINLLALAALGCQHLYRADIWFAPRLLGEGNLRLLREAGVLGMKTSIDVNWDPHWHAGRDAPLVCGRIEGVVRALPDVTYVHGNERELCFFAGHPTLQDAARWFFAHGARSLIVHAGAAGSAAMTADGSIVHAPAEPVIHAINEAGTGDVFTAAFLLREGMEMSRRLMECNAVAGAHLSGAQVYIPRLPS